MKTLTRRANTEPDTEHQSIAAAEQLKYCS